MHDVTRLYVTWLTYRHTRGDGGNRLVRLEWFCPSFFWTHRTWILRNCASRHTRGALHKVLRVLHVVCVAGVLQETLSVAGHTSLYEAHLCVSVTCHTLWRAHMNTFICMMWLIHIPPFTRVHQCVTWLIHKIATIYSRLWLESFIFIHKHARGAPPPSQVFTIVWHDSSILL